jgi:aquaporin Z
MEMSFNKRFAAELIGTFWLVLGGCGSAVISATFGISGIGMLGVALAFGLTVTTMAYAIGHISGCHLNPAVSVGLAVGGRFSGRDVPGYILAQVLGAILASWTLFLIASGRPGFDIVRGLAANGYGAHSPGYFALFSCALTEIILTFMFVFIILGATERRATQGLAPVAIGLALTIANLVGIPVTNLSVNPARSTGPAVIMGGWALQQLWLFWLAPLVGGVLAGVVYPAIAREGTLETVASPRRAA